MVIKMNMIYGHRMILSVLHELRFVLSNIVFQDVDHLIVADELILKMLHLGLNRWIGIPANDFSQPPVVQINFVFPEFQLFEPLLVFKMQV